MVACSWAVGHLIIWWQRITAIHWSSSDLTNRSLLLIVSVRSSSHCLLRHMPQPGVKAQQDTTDNDKDQLAADAEDLSGLGKGDDCDTDSSSSSEVAKRKRVTAQPSKQAKKKKKKKEKRDKKAKASHKIKSRVLGPKHSQFLWQVQ